MVASSSNQNTNSGLNINITNKKSGSSSDPKQKGVTKPARGSSHYSATRKTYHRANINPRKINANNSTKRMTRQAAKKAKSPVKANNKAASSNVIEYDMESG